MIAKVRKLEFHFDEKSVLPLDVAVEQGRVSPEALRVIEATAEGQRTWAMADKNTFDIPPIRSLVKSYLAHSKVSIDVFARNKRWATYTNDLNPETAAEYHMDALEFLQMLEANGVKADLLIFDPPYSLEQCKRAYEAVDRTPTMRDTQVWNRWTEHKQIISRLIEPNGVVLSFGWNSCGIGMKYGFKIEDILLVCHGAGHNDTICTVERKVESSQNLLFHSAVDKDESLLNSPPV
jgi:hypothetical protein